jgi:hypothetical protein
MKTITLGDTVVVSDPCYSIPTWCQCILKDVLPGRYNVMCDKFSSDGWGERVSTLMVVHEHFNTENKLSWRREPADIGVDSGQCGIFDKKSYRSDDAAERIATPIIDFMMPYNDTDGDKWYEKICKFTLSDEQWGVYDTGAVSCSGIGDGGYTLRVAKFKGKVIGILLDYHMEVLNNNVIELLRQSHIL